MVHTDDILDDLGSLDSGYQGTGHTDNRPCPLGGSTGNYALQTVGSARDDGCGLTKEFFDGSVYQGNVFLKCDLI
jgi:hypothetical protein